jgi:hypothetical protein
MLGSGDELVVDTIFHHNPPDANDVARSFDLQKSRWESGDGDFFIFDDVKITRGVSREPFLMNSVEELFRIVDSRGGIGVRRNV